MVNLPDVLYRYRLHPNQATQQKEKTFEKVRIVRRNYLKATLPSISEKSIEAFPKKVWPVFAANLRSGFFDKKILAKRLYKYKKAGWS